MPQDYGKPFWLINSKVMDSGYQLFNFH